MKPSSFYSISTFSVFFFLLFYWFFFPHFSCVRFLYAVAAFCYLFFSSFHFAMVNFTEQFASSIDSIYIFTISVPRWYSVSFHQVVFIIGIFIERRKNAAHDLYLPFPLHLVETFFQPVCKNDGAPNKKKTDKLKQRCTLKLFISKHSVHHKVMKKFMQIWIWKYFLFEWLAHSNLHWYICSCSWMSLKYPFETRNTCT